MENRYTSFNLLPHVRKSLVDFPLSPHKSQRVLVKNRCRKKQEKEKKLEMPNQPKLTSATVPSIVFSNSRNIFL